MATGKKFYWLKLDRNFFKRHDIRVIEEQPNGKDYILFYLKLLVESIDHEGSLRFSDTIPYDEKMLAVISNTNIDIVRNAIKIFTELELMEIYDDKTIYLKETNKMLGYETDWARQKKEYRQQTLLATVDNVRIMSAESPHDVRQEIEKDIELEKDKDLKESSSIEEVKKSDVFKDFAKDDIKLYKTLRDFKDMRDRIKKGMTQRAKEMLVNKLSIMQSEGIDIIACLEQSVFNSWQGVFMPRDLPKKPTNGGKYARREQST